MGNNVNIVAKRVKAFCVLMQLIASVGFAQSANFTSRLYVDGTLHYGFVTPHKEYISYFINDHVTGYQLNVGVVTKGEKQWHRYYNYPKIGVGFYRSGLGNNLVYGKMNALYGYVDRYFIKGNPRFNFGNSISFGISYITKRYDNDNNYFDMAIGSKLNVYIHYSLNGLARINDKTYFKIGLGVIHASNGNYQEPNKGLNLFTVSGGVQYIINKPNTSEFIKTDISKERKRNYWLLMGGLGRKQFSQQYKQKYTPLALSVEYSREISQTSMLGSSINIYYDPSLQKKIELLNDTASRTDLVRVAANLSYELRMGKLSYVIQPGIYLKNSYSNSGVMSNRIGIRYQISPCLLAAVTIKAHWAAMADFIEWGIGYRWKY